MNAVDGNNFFLNENADDIPSEDIGSQRGFTSLDEMVNSANFNNPINLPVNRTVGEFILMIVKCALVHVLSLTQIYD